MSSRTDQLSLELIEFLRSFKNSESLSPELRSEISVRTKLQQFLLEVCGAGRTILLTGSAGAGKTHLLDAVVTELRSSHQICKHRAPTGDASYVLICEDATELTPAERIKFVQRNDKRCACKIMAINEGPLREAARSKGGEYFNGAIRLLHEGQRGVARPYDAHKPTVIDLGAYDPLEEGSIAFLLDLDILHKAVALISPNADSPRRRAWEFLRKPTVRRHVAAVAKLAKFANPEWLFRDIWDFIADLALGGSDDEPIPSSPWFWRLFFGDSLISRAILSVAHPIKFALPAIESRLWYRDWNSEKLKFVEGLTILPIGNGSEEAFLWAKAQCLLLLDGYEFDQAVLRGANERLSAAVQRGDISSVVRQINDYVTFGLGETNEVTLDLWTDHRIERRAKAHGGLIKLGSAPVSEFSIRKSLVTLNHPNSDAAALPGTHSLLVHNRTNSVFSLDRRRLGTLERSRPTRISDRDHVDLQWDLYRFFDAVLSTEASPNMLTVCQVDVEHGTFYERRYAVSAKPPILEARS